MMLKHSLILVLMIAGTSSAVSSLSFHVRAGRPQSHADTDRALSVALACEFDSRARCSTVSREIPSFCILAMRVVRFSPSLEAAPLFPPTTQCVSRRAPRMCTRSASASVHTSWAKNHSSRVPR